MELTHERKTVFVPHWSRYVVGCDIGQTVDPTAIAVVEHLTGVNDSGSDWERHTGLSGEFQQPAVQFNVRHLERLPLQTRYGDVVRYVANLLAKPPLCSTENKRAADLVVDASGVGMGVCDMFSEAGMRPIKIVITAGGEVATCTGLDKWNISKHALITQLDAMLSHDKRPLRFASALTEREAMKDELARLSTPRRQCGPAHICCARRKARRLGDERCNRGVVDIAAATRTSQQRGLLWLRSTRTRVLEMDELERLIKLFRTAVETEKLRYQVTDAADVIGFIGDVHAHHFRCLQQIQILRIENRGRHQIEAACEAAERQAGRITTQAVDDANKLGRVVVGAA